jgi:RNA polymerase sigma-70 factor (ECF subfamily)
VLQETALALWKKFDEYDRSQPFLPWARRFARYEVLMYHRRRQRYTFLSEPLIEALVERQEASEDTEDRRRMLIDCMEKLPDSDQLLLRSRYADPGVTIQKLAESTGQTANALYKALQRIRRQLLLCVSRRLASPTG